MTDTFDGDARNDSDARNNPDARIDPDARIGRVTLTVADLDATTAFYRDAVGLAVHERDGDRTCLGAGGEDLVVLEHDPEAIRRPPDAAGLFHTAFLFPSRGALGDALARVRAAGYGLTGASDHSVSEALYLRDPEGNGVELYRDRPREEWPEAGSEVRMDTHALDVDALRSDRAGHEGAEGPGGAPGGTTVGHVHLEVTDLANAEKFYVYGLGFSVRQRWDTEALFVAAGDYHHHVGLNTWNGRTLPVSGRGLDEFEVVVPGRAALEAVRDGLVDAGDVVESDGGALTVHDPDNIRVRVRAE